MARIKSGYRLFGEAAPQVVTQEDIRELRIRQRKVNAAQRRRHLDRYYLRIDRAAVNDDSVGSPIGFEPAPADDRVHYLRSIGIPAASTRDVAPVPSVEDNDLSSILEQMMPHAVMWQNRVFFA